MRKNQIIDPHILFENFTELQEKNVYLNPLGNALKHIMVGVAAGVGTSQLLGKQKAAQFGIAAVSAIVSAYIDHRKDACRKRCKSSRNECYYKCYVDASKELQRRMDNEYQNAARRGEAQLAHKLLAKRNFAEDLVKYYEDRLKKVREKK